jgi:hypothetical protein
MWAFRNPVHNWYYSHKITGVISGYSGWATCHRPDSGIAWRTLVTNYSSGEFAHKYGRWINTARSILGKQRICFYINDRKYFRFSGARPRHLWGNLYWVPEYKFGFESVNWANQLHLFRFKRYSGQFTYQKTEVG